MAFVTGLVVIDAQASALNNLGNIPGERYDNSVGVKVIKTKEGSYPYVSAQAYRYWLRETLSKTNLGWKPSPIFREDKIAYTDANPIKWWDDDLFGYMRAPSKRESAKAKREANSSMASATETLDTVTRVAPFRMSTLVSLAPTIPTNDFGVMARHEGDPVPHEHQFYRTTLKGLFSLDLQAAGTFSYMKKTGYRNLDDIRKEEAEKEGLIHLETEKAYRLPDSERVKRVAALFEGMAFLDGGAKQALHYTDVASPLVVMAVTKGGNHIFNYCLGPNSRHLPEFNLAAFCEVLEVYADEILSDIYVGWTRGYLDSEREKLEQYCASEQATKVRISHPREAFKAFIEQLSKPENECWLA